jgi:C-terminal processing protease CtpA/Prc
MMKQTPQAILVGEISYGSSGNARPLTLRPGLTVFLPTTQALRPDGTLYEGEGIEPHMHVRATAEQLRDGDPVLSEALLRLRNQR